MKHVPLPVFRQITMNSDQRCFVLGQVFSMSMMATAQRGRLYAEGVSERVRLELRSALRERLEGLLPKYLQPVSESEHAAVIGDLANFISSTRGYALQGGRLRIGSSQKVLNLYLKYMWCFGEIAMPPHCPFDSLVLARIPSCTHVRWTRLDSIDEYQRIVREAKIEAGTVSLAEWELRLYNDALAPIARVWTPDPAVSEAPSSAKFGMQR